MLISSATRSTTHSCSTSTATGSLIALGASSAHFDLDDDGVIERTGWVSPHDGLLVQDSNGNGLVDGVAELIGSGTVDGFVELATLDSNADGKIDASDPAFAQLLVWRDLDADGTSTLDEMLTLNQVGISRFNLAFTQVNSNVGGNVIARTGSYVRTDGSSRNMASVQFALDQTTGRPVIPADADVRDLLVLPNLPGFAAIPDLHTAMYFDPVLKAMVSDLVFGDHEFETFTEFAAGGFAEILYRWAGIDISVSSDPERPFYYDLFEAFTGMSINPDSHSDLEQLADVWPWLLKELRARFLFQAAQYPKLQPLLDLSPQLAALDLDSPTWLDDLDALLDGAHAEAAAIAPAYEYLELFTGLTLNPATGELSGDFDAFAARFIEDQPPFLTVWMGGAGGGGVLVHPWFQWHEDQGSLLYHVAAAMGLGQAYVLNTTGWRWFGEIVPEYYGTAGNDLVDVAGTLDQRIYGNEGDDELRGNGGVDRLVGGPGNDLLKGGSGSDMYVYAAGDGLDRIIDDSGADDVIYLSNELNRADARVLRPAGTNDLLLHFGDPAAGIILTNQWTSSATAIDALHFVAEDGMDSGDISSLYLASVATAGADVLGGSWASERLIGLEGNDTLNAAAGNDEVDGGVGADALDGGTGNDALFGGADADQLLGQAGDDVLDGGTGNDLMRGGGDDDTYLFGLGGGEDIVRDYITATLVNYGGYDTIRLAAGIMPGDVTIAQSDAGTDLVLTFAGTADRLILDETTNDSGYRIEQLVFADGTVWTHADMFYRAVAPTAGDDVFYGGYNNESLAGGGGNDTLIANRGGDILDGGAGNDLLRGGGDDDTYVFAPGMGQDIVRDYITATLVNYGGWDTILFAAGITPASLTVSQGDAGDDLIIAFAGSTDRITLDETTNDSGYRIERMLFADGTVLTHADLFALATTPTAGNDVFYGGYDGESLAGGAGDDTLVANRGNDGLDGGTGNDVLRGGGGNDVYRFALGDGQDSVRDYIEATLVNYGGTDTVELGAGIAPSDVVVVQGDLGDDLILKIGTGGDRITLEETVSDGNYRIEQLRFADATLWTYADMLAMAKTPKASADSYWCTSWADALSAGDGADFVYGRAGDDALGGDGGDDTLYGEDGNDTLNGGDGNDQMSGGAGNDIFIGAAGADVMTGGSGADTFRFDGLATGLGTAADRITDFAAGLD